MAFFLEWPMNILFFNVVRWKMADKMTSKIRLSSIKTAVEIQSGLNLCKPGFITLFSDINECSGSNDCNSTLATCTNTPGAYKCACKAGYTGDGRTCTGKNVCPAVYLSVYPAVQIYVLLSINLSFCSFFFWGGKNCVFDIKLPDNRLSVDIFFKRFCIGPSSDFDVLTFSLL